MRLNKLFFGSLMMAGAIFAQQAAAPDAGDPPDEPGHAVARISVLSGDASVRRSDTGEWVAAALNAPLLTGDSVSVAAGGAVEVQLDRANFARVAGDSEIRLSELDNGRQQIQLAKGLVTWRVLRDSAAQTEISTPSAAVRPGVNASVRIEVAPDGTTRVTVRHGDAEVYSQRGTEQVHEGNSVSVRSDGDSQVGYAPASDQWDGWNDERDSYLQRAQSPRYVSQDVYGAEDLDNYGRWDYDAAYGNVWVPTVASTWAPYRDGHWVWEPFYGWTWVDYSPWGWAPFHYGSWYNRPGIGWSWFPGRRYERSWWRPALVGFVGFGGGGGFGFGFGNIGWVPLAPYERFHPWYGRGWNGGRNVVVNNFNIHNTNIYGAYRNARFSGGVTAVSTADFQRGNFRNRVSVDSSRLQATGMTRGQIQMSSTAQNMRFTERAASNSAPRADLSSQRFVSRGTAAAPSSQSRGFAAPTQQRSQNTGERMTSNPAWQRFGTPQTENSGRQFGGNVQRQYSAPAPSQQPQAQSRSFYNGPSRQVQVAPPLVQERQSTPNYSQRGSFGSPSGYQANRSYSVPQRSAPAASPSYRGGGESRPAARSESAAPRGGGGGGGQRSSGGGGNSGGHGRR